MKTKNKELTQKWEQDGTICWRVHTPALLKEIMSNNECAILRIPLQIFATMLAEVGDIASRINDTELNSMMLRLAIYAEADPDNKEMYNYKLVRETIKEAYKIKKQRLSKTQTDEN